MSIASANIKTSLGTASPDDRIDYNDRLNRVTAYIYDHLDEDIDLNRLAEVACLSPYHRHRVYHALHGETIATTVRRLRLHRAAGFLAYSSMPMDEIAAKSGYSSVQAFPRAFHADLRSAAGAVPQGGARTRPSKPRRARPRRATSRRIRMTWRSGR